MACLSYILGVTGKQIRDWLDRKGAIDLANIISLALGKFETLTTGGAEGDVVDVFRQMLNILAEGIVSGHANVDLPLDQVVRFHEIYTKFAGTQVPDVIMKRLWYISDTLPPASHVEGPIDIPSPEPDSETTPSPGISQKLRQRLHKTQGQIGGTPDSGGGGSSAPTRDRVGSAV